MNLLSIEGLSKDLIVAIIDFAEKLRIKKREGFFPKILKDKTLVMVFEKDSLRTRATFEIAMFELGGHAVNMDKGMIKLGERETIEDAAKNFSRWADVVMVRTFEQERIEKFAGASSIPVINGLTNEFHPCQVLAFYEALTMNNAVKNNLKLCFVGDGNNLCNSLALLSAFMGWRFVHIGPENYFVKDEFVKRAQKIASNSSNFSITRTSNINMVEGADVIYTDVWTSMGKESEAKERQEIFKPYQINSDVLQIAGKNCLVSHCLPAHRGREITDDVLDSKNSIAFDEAECRLHVQKAILVYLITGKLDHL